MRAIQEEEPGTLPAVITPITREEALIGSRWQDSPPGSQRADAFFKFLELMLYHKRFYKSESDLPPGLVFMVQKLDDRGGIRTAFHDAATNPDLKTAIESMAPAGPQENDSAPSTMVTDVNPGHDLTTLDGLRRHREREEHIRVVDMLQREANMRSQERDAYTKELRSYQKLLDNEDLKDPSSRFLDSLSDEGLAYMRGLAFPDLPGRRQMWEWVRHLDRAKNAAQDLFPWEEPVSLMAPDLWTEKGLRKPRLIFRSVVSPSDRAYTDSWVIEIEGPDPARHHLPNIHKDKYDRVMAKQVTHQGEDFHTTRILKLDGVRDSGLFCLERVGEAHEDGDPAVPNDEFRTLGPTPYERALAERVVQFTEGLEKRFSRTSDLRVTDRVSVAFDPSEDGRVVLQNEFLQSRRSPWPEEGIDVMAVSRPAQKQDVRR